MGIEDIISKNKNKANILVPKNYKPVPSRERKNTAIPENWRIYRKMSSNTNAVVMICEVGDEWNPMPFDEDAVVSALRQELNEEQGIIEVGVGEMNSGSRYVYSIFKQGRGEDNFGVDYNMNINCEIDNVMYFVSATFEEIGMTGIRDNAIYAMLKNENGESFSISDGWFEDPYDKNWHKGFLMNKSEYARFDEVFPEHPLSEARSLLNYLIENN